MILSSFPKVIQCGLASLLLGVVLLHSAQAGTKVRIATPAGNIDLELYDQERPITVQNFLKYVSSGRYAGSFAHRLIPGFVLQGGGFTYNGTSNSYSVVETYAAIQNEYGNLPVRSNVKGTITMAKVGGDPNSATSQWFINLKDNNTGTADEGNLDLQNGGFTVFGRVVAGMSVLETFNTAFVHSDTGGLGVYDASTYFGSEETPNGNFTDMPLTSSADVEAGLFLTTISVIPPEVAPSIKIKATKVKTKAAATKIAGSSSSSVARLEWRVGSKGQLRKQSVSTSWKLRVSGLKRGTNVLWVRGVTAEGKKTAFKKIKIVRS